jgi:serine/threonine protein kinase
MAPDAGSHADDETAVRRAIKSCPECAQNYSSDSMFCPFDGTRLEDMTWIAPTDPSVDPLLGTTVDGRYRILRVLGEGGTGTVYEVNHESLQRTFAMKVLRRDVASDDALAARFIQEARATASLKHPHIVSITDFGRLPDKTPYFVMERLVGHTLAHVCKVGGQLPTARAVHIILQVAGALAAAHEAGIVHRDLKPENLFLVGRIDGTRESGEEGGDEVRVVDFGAAKIAGASRITKTGIVFGTPHYMAPEQASGQPVDHRADIYALGVIMYEIFTGHLPFEADTLMGVLTKQMFVEPPPFASVLPSGGADPESARLLGALEEVTLRAMTKKPEHRFQTMAALAEELDRTVSFPDSGRVTLASGWRPQPRRRSARPPSELSRALEGPDRAEIYPSGDLPVLPRTSWRGGAFVGMGVALLAVVAGSMAFGRNVAPHAVALAATTPPTSSVPPIPPPASPPAANPMPGFIHVTTTPPFAEIWQDGRRVGTAPMDIPFSASGPAATYTLRAPGYASRQLLLDATSPASTELALDKLSPPASAPIAAPPSKAHTKPRHVRSDGELVDPFDR